MCRLGYRGWTLSFAGAGLEHQQQFHPVHIFDNSESERLPARYRIYSLIDVLTQHRGRWTAAYCYKKVRV